MGFFIYESNGKHVYKKRKNKNVIAHFNIYKKLIF